LTWKRLRTINDIYEVWVLVVNSLYHDEPYYFSTEKKAIEFINEFYPEAYLSMLSQRSFSGIINKINYGIRLFAQRVDPYKITE